MGIRVILLEDISGFGKRGEIKNAADGYARNFLFRKRLAKPVSPQVLNQLKTEKEINDKKIQKEKDTAKIIKQKIEKINLIFKIKTKKSGLPFGSITSKMIADELSKHGLVLKKDQIDVKPIKIFGNHKIKIRLHQDTEADLSVSMEPEK